MTISYPRAQIRIALFAFIGLLLSGIVAMAFDDRNTARPIAAGDSKLAECRTIRPAAQKIDCVADSLDAAARRITHRGPGYRYIKRTLRAAAADIRKSKSYKRARGILTRTATQLRKAWLDRGLYAGPSDLAKTHFERFARFTGRAKSVLRS